MGKIYQVKKKKKDLSSSLQGIQRCEHSLS